MSRAGRKPLEGAELLDTLPDGSRYVKLSQAATALGLPLRQLRTWCDSGTLSYAQFKRGSRWLSVATLKELEASGFSVDWLSLEE